MILLCTFILSACNFFESTATTYMNINDNGSGTRVITCSTTINDLNKKIDGGEQAFDEFLCQNCPQQFTYDKSNTASNITYNFYLSFGNAEDYSNKVNSLILKNPELVFNTPDNVFVKGISLKENFTSEDLMNWLNNGLYQAGIMQAGDYLWKYEDNYITYEDQVFSTDKNLEAMYMDYLPIDKIKIDTTLYDEQGALERQVSFYISNDVSEKLGNSIDEFMNTLVPEIATSQWSTVNNDRIFTVSFSANNEEELEQYMNQILDNNQSYAKISVNSPTVFSSTNDFTENLNFSSFPSNKDGKTFVEYNFKMNTEQGIQYAKSYENSDWIDSNENLKDNVFSLSKDTDMLCVSLTEGVEFPVESVDIDTKILASGNIQKDIDIDFKYDENNTELTKAKEFFDSLKLEFISTSTHDNHCIISIGGSESEVNIAQNELFGEGNSISIKKTNNFSLYNQNSVVDKINLSKFLGEIGYSGQIGYTLTVPIELDSYTTQENNSSEISSYKADSKQIYTVLPSTGITKITSNASTINGTFVLSMTLIILVLVALLILIIYLIIKNTRKDEPQGINQVDNKIPEFLYSGYKCPNCHMPLYLGMNYCPSCGKKIIKQETKNK